MTDAEEMQKNDQRWKVITHQMLGIIIVYVILKYHTWILNEFH